MKTDSKVRGIILMIASMVSFSLADTMVKLATGFMSPAQVLFYLITGPLFIFSLIAKLQGDRLMDKRAFSPMLVLRYFAEVTGMVGMVQALAHVPISSVGAITQASPLLATVGAVFFLNETVGWRRWASIVIGFIGVLLIIQPGAVEFDYAVLWAVLALIALSVRDLSTRLVPRDMPSSSLATYTMMAALPCTVLWVLINGESLLPPQINWLVVVPMILFGATGYLLLIASIRTSEVTVVLPFRYTRIIFLMVIGVIVFKEKPDILMITGASMIIISGTYILLREHQASIKATKLKNEKSRD